MFHEFSLVAGSKQRSHSSCSVSFLGAGVSFLIELFENGRGIFNNGSYGIMGRTSQLFNRAV